jgi:hypothetical protein
MRDAVRGIPALAAGGELRSLARGAPVFRRSHSHHGACQVVPHAFVPALAATDRRSHTRVAAKPARQGRREVRRLDFRARSSETAGTMARDGCEQGLAVHSVRS